MNVKRLGALFVAAVLMMAAVPTVASDATVGDFVIKLAKARKLAASDARVAGDALRGVGIRVPANLNYTKQLTEGDVARLSRSLGLNVTTASPDNPFNSDQVDRFFATFAADISFNGGQTSAGDSAQGDGNGLGFNPYSKGKGGSKGKKKGHDFTPTDPE